MKKPNSSPSFPNTKGFVLMETLIVSVFVMGIFVFLYANLFPLVGEYERIETYDDLDSKYAAHLVRKMILEKGSSSTQSFTLSSGTYRDLSTCNTNNYTDLIYCNQLMSKLSITKVYLTKYDLTDFKNTVMNHYLPGSDRALEDYVAYLPTFSTDSAKDNAYRVIVEMDHGEYKSYGTIEVRR